MDNFDNIFQIHQIMFIVVRILVIVGIVFTFIMMFSSKFRGKFMSHQVKAVKHMTDYSKEDIENIMKNMGNVMANSQNDIINQNEEILKNIANKNAEINKDAIRTTVSAIKDGFENGKTVFCKHCGSKIDADSKFCKSCGKEQ